MSDFPEKENLINTQTENTETVTENDQESTIFSNPVEHTKKSDTVKVKKRWTIVLASVLAVAVLVGGTFAVVKLIPEREEEQQSGPAIESISVMNMAKDKLKTVTIKNSSGTFKLHSEKASTDSSESSTEVTKWYLEGYDKDVVSNATLSTIVGNVASFSASREVTTRTAADCGLENPLITVDVMTTDDKQFSILWGNESPDKSGYYLKLSDSDKIYVVDTSVRDEFDFVALDLADTSSLPAIETDDTNYRTEDTGLITFDSLQISGKNFNTPVLITPNNDDSISSFAQFIVSDPDERIADNIDGIFAAYNNGIGVIGAYSFDVSAKSLAAVGLDNPDFVSTMKIKDVSLTYKFKLQDDGFYAAVCDGVKLIKKVDATSLPFINYTASDFYSSWVCLNAIDDLKNFTFNVGEKSYSFDIEANPDEDSEEKYIIKIDGKNIKSQTFQNFYQQCISLSCNDYTIQKLTAKPEISLIFKFKDDIGGEQVVNFVKSDATRYEFSLNGKAMGRVNSSELNQLVKLLESTYKTAY